MKWVFGFNLTKGQRVFGIQNNNTDFYIGDMYVNQVLTDSIKIHNKLTGIETYPIEIKFLVKY
jgi:hypothetical protein